MPVKTTIRTAEKRVIKHEMSTLRKAARKVATDIRQERKKLFSAQRQIELSFARLNRRETSALSNIGRRISILEGRL